MMTQHPLAGVYAAAVTPLKHDSTLDLDSVPALLNFFASRGCHGIVLFGTTGEGPSFSPTERETLMRAACEAREQLPGFRLLAGTGTPSLSETIELTRLAFDLGYAVLSGTDSYLQMAMENKAAGCITAPANILSPDLRQVWDLMNEGKDAMEAQARVIQQRDILDKYPPFPPTLKVLLHRFHGFPRWSVKPPLVEMMPEMEEKLVGEFESV